MKAETELFVDEAVSDSMNWRGDSHAFNRQTVDLSQYPNLVVIHLSMRVLPHPKLILAKTRSAPHRALEKNSSMIPATLVFGKEHISMQAAAEAFCDNLPSPSDSCASLSQI
ncbi:MAG TPA: hypothetical protein VGG59_13320 [Acidobacteriaceae bacterium]